MKKIANLESMSFSKQFTCTSCGNKLSASDCWNRDADCEERICKDCVKKFSSL